MSKRPSTSSAGESSNNASGNSSDNAKVAKYMSITQDGNQAFCKYMELLQETANKYKLQNANSPQEKVAISKLTAFQKLFSEIDMTKTLSQAAVFCKLEGTRSIEEQLREKLFLHFGFREFRPNQLEVMKALLEGHDIFVRKPTGGGKSLLYSLPCLLSKGIAFIICPLIALMQDQVQKLHQAKIPAVALHSQVVEKDRIIENLKKDKISYKVVFLTPERALSMEFSKILEIMVEKKNIAYVAFDESHVIIHDVNYRWAYSKVGQLKKQIPHVPVMAVTATATPSTQSQIISRLGLSNPQIFSEGVDRSNISLEVRAKKLDKVHQQIATLILSEFKNQMGIVYQLSTDDCKSCVKILKEKGINAECYFGGYERKEESQVAWTEERVKVMVCTNAFAMGIDKKNVRFVIHATLAHSVVDYFQQFGRAGRDGLKSKAITFYHPHDVQRVANLITKNAKTSQLSEDYQVSLLSLFDLQDYMEMTAECRRRFLLAYFGDNPPSRCEQAQEVCDNCFHNEAVTTMEMWDTTKAILVWLEDVGSADFSALQALLKGQQQGADPVCGLLRHWPMDDIGRYLRHVCRSRIFAQVSQKDHSKAEVMVKLEIGLVPPEFNSARTLLFPMKKKNHSAIMALRESDTHPILPQINYTPLDTQSRETLESAMKQFPSPPPVNCRNSVAEYDRRGQY